MAHHIDVRWVCGVLSGAMLATTLLGCQSSASDFWAQFSHAGAVESEQYNSLREMSEAADAVVIAHLTDFGRVREIQGDAVEDIVRMIGGDLAIDRTLSGASYDSPLPLEFVLVEQGEPWQDTVEGIRGSFPRDSMLVFLREKRDGSGQFRVVNSLGLILDDGDGFVAPLAEQPDLAEGPYADEVEGHDDLADLAAALAAR